MQKLANTSYETRTRIQGVLLLLTNAEAGQRGYIITGNPDFLPPYERARDEIDSQLQDLGTRLQGDAVSRALMRQLQVASTNKLAELLLVIERRRQGGLPAVLDEIAEGSGDRLMTEISLIGEEMIAHEASKVEVATAAAEARRQRVEIQITALLALLLMLAVATAYLLWRHLKTSAQLLDRLEATAARQSAIFHGTIDGVITLNPSGSIESLNRAAEKMFGYEPAEILRRDVTLLIEDLAHEGEGLFLTRLAETHGELTHGVVREMTGRRSDGSTFAVDVALGAIQLLTGTHVVAIVRDISERRRVESMKHDFVSTVSHELRTPMTSVAGSLGLLAGGAGGELPEKAMRLISIAQANSQRLVRLINDILDIEKLEGGAVTLSNDNLDLRDIALRSIEGTAGYALDLGVTMTLADGPEAPVRGDADRLIQVATNLLSNAIKFSPAGGQVLVSVLNERRLARLSVRDFGPGVPETFRAQIFTKFAQAEGGGAGRNVGTGGTGLGLAISREIAERHGGRLWFESSPGEGATFHLDLPLRLADPMASPSDRPRVLIAEDDPDAGALIKELLDTDGFAAEVVNTSAIALGQALSQDYDAMLVDLHLPDGDGISLIRAVRERFTAADLPIIVISGDAARGRARGGSLDVLDWMEKPLDAQRLRTAVSRAIDGGLNHRPHLLHVEDDCDMQHIVAEALSGIAVIHQAASLQEARAYLLESWPDGVILDLGLPDGSGLDLLPALIDGSGQPIPVVVFSAQELDAATTHGVDAVLTKSRTSLTTLARTIRRLTLNPLF